MPSRAWSFAAADRSSLMVARATRSGDRLGPVTCECAGPAAALRRFALERADRVVGELELVAAAHEQAERPLAGAVVGRRDAELSPQQGDRRFELIPGVALRQGRLD